MSDRQIIVVDTETTGLHTSARVLEVAAINIETGEELFFAPYHDRDAIKWAEPQALQINRYFERGVFEDMESQDDTAKIWYPQLTAMLKGNTFAGSNPTFDAGKLPIKKVWHHRLLDLSAYAAGVLGVPPSELPGANTVCDLLGVKNEEEHSARGDARATAECFRKLMARGAGFA